jgi:hypothetical protein
MRVLENSYKLCNVYTYITLHLADRHPPETIKPKDLLLYLLFERNKEKRGDSWPPSK